MNCGHQPIRRSTALLTVTMIGWLAASFSPFTVASPAPNPRAMAFVSIAVDKTFQLQDNSPSGEWVFVSKPIEMPIEWDELILSWNVPSAPQAGFQFEVRPVFTRENTAKDRFYHLGHWATDPARYPRESVNGQKDDLAEVQTDTLVLRQPARSAQFRITLRDERKTAPSILPLDFLGVSVLRRPSFTGLLADSVTTNALTLPVPERSQVAYTGGREWCSPTSVSMVLGYWAGRLKSPALDLDVPAVAAGVHDPKWSGTGNWPFNTAFAGLRAPLRAYVTRLADVRDLDQLLEAGVPSIVSVSFDLLAGKEKDAGTGHLIVCVGRTATGDFIINDPWAFLDQGERVQRTIPRARLALAWARSRGAVYLIHPMNWPMPTRPNAPWLVSSPIPATATNPAPIPRR